MPVSVTHSSLEFDPYKDVTSDDDITEAGTAGSAGRCLGGALTAMTAAHLNVTGNARVGSGTLLNTLHDCSDPGALSMLTDERTVAQLEKQWRPRASSKLNDHIVPWQWAYHATRLLAGDLGYVLTSGATVARIVKPPAPKAW